MGTNFYIADREPVDSYEYEHDFHIGKRYAAGNYCWDCKQPTGPGEWINFGGSMLQGTAKTCPICGVSSHTEALNNSSAGRELGFNKSVPIRKSGVASASGFIWAISIEKLEGVSLVEDEYGRKYTRDEFMQMLEECPIQEFHSIGKVFS